MKKIFFFTLFSIILNVFIFSEKAFNLDLKKDSFLLTTGILLSGADLFLDNYLEVNRTEYKNQIYEKKDINRFDRFFMHSYSKNYDKAANFTLVAALSSPLVLVSTQKNEWTTEIVMYAETLLIANGIKELLKLSINRTRPYMYYNDSKPNKDIKKGDFENSFPSGHSTMAFSGATFATYTFAKYFPESKLKIPVAVASYGFAISTAALRVKSGNHFVSDVTVGAMIGSCIGFLVPWLHTFNEKNDLNINFSSNELIFKVKL